MATSTTLLFPWSDTFSVHIGTIDTQHRKLVDMVNDLHQAMLTGHSKERLGKILSELINYTAAHFKTEEDLMKLHHYPDYAQHKSEHDRLTKTALDLQHRFEAQEAGLTLDVMDFLKTWLTKHILESDKRYGPFLTAKGVK